MKYPEHVKKITDHIPKDFLFLYFVLFNPLLEVDIENLLDQELQRYEKVISVDKHVGIIIRSYETSRSTSNK